MRPLGARAGLDSSDGEDGGGGGNGGARANGRAVLSPEERERKRLRRLMRNRASAQQARERKKNWTSSIEERARELQLCVEHLQGRANMLERENWALRALLKTATAPSPPAGDAAADVVCGAEAAALDAPLLEVVA